MLSFSRTYSSIQSGVYFANEFSFTFWASKSGKTTDNLNWPRIFDFVDTAGQNRIVLSLGGQDRVYLHFREGDKMFQMGARPDLQSDWTFVTVTYKDKKVKYYFNETCVGQGESSFDRRGAQTDMNYFGKDIAGSLDAVFRMINFKIYTRQITEEEMLIDFNRGLYTVQTMIKN